MRPVQHALKLKQELTLWIAGPFGPQYGSRNGYAPGGIGWYRKTFDLKAEQQGQRGIGCAMTPEFCLDVTGLALR